MTGSTTAGAIVEWLRTCCSTPGVSHDRLVEVDERFAVREVERRVRVDLAPDEHVLGGQRDLLVAVADVGADGRHHLVLRHVDLRVEIGHAELAAPAAAGRHLDHAERRALVGEQDLVAILRVHDVDLLRQILAGERLVEQLQHVGRLAPSFDDAVDAQLVPGVGLRDLPAARAADDDLEVPADAGCALMASNSSHRVVRVDRLLRRPEDRRVDAGGEGDAERVVRRDGDDPRVGPDELVEVGGIAARDVARPGSAAGATLRARGRRPACSCADPSSLYSTLRQVGYFLLRMPSSHIGSEAMLIWMK